MKKITIAIDGHSSCGKSTMAKDLAREVGYVYVDTGAMYRCVTLFALRNGLFAADGSIDEAGLRSRMNDIHISFKFNPEAGRPDTYLNGELVERDIRTMEVSSHVSPIATLGFVREAMVAQQQEMGRGGGVVMDGRDIGTVVFPNAELKIFVTASAEVRAQRRYDELKAKGMERLVLDLRDNSGGLLSAALGICDELLPDRELIVYTQGAHQRRQEEHSSRGGLFCKGELIVMIDEYSASASEIVAGAVQDNDRGLIVGRRSFGKGLVQQRFPLPDRSAIQLTTSRYYTPSGRCIQRPYNKGTDEYYADFAQNIIDEYDGDSTLYKINDSTPYYTAKGRTVYGGGGIYPDHTIHYKSDENVVYYNRLLNKGLLSDYIFDYVSYKGSTIKQKHPTEESFLKNYTVSDAMLEQLFANAEKKGIARDAKGIARYREEIRTRIKAGIGDMLYSNNAFYYLLLPYDPELKEALSLMK